MKTFIPTPFLFIGFNKDAIDKIFLDPNSLATTDIIQKIKEYSGDKDDFLLFENYANPNFLKLEHTFGAGGNGGYQIQIDLIDPSNEFERRMIGTTSYPENVPFSLIDSSGTPISISDSQKLESKVRRELYLDSIKQYVSQNTTRNYYIAYGVGTNPRYWAGPFSCILLKADIETSEFKKISCTFAASPAGFGQETIKKFKNTKNAVDMQGMKRQITGASKPIKFNEFIEGKSESFYDPYLLATKQSNSIAEIKSSIGSKLGDKQGDKLSSVSNFVKMVDFHALVTDCIANYVAKVTGNDNVIVLLPNLNYLLASSEGFVEDLEASKNSSNEKFKNVNDIKLRIALRFRQALSDALSYLSQMSQVIYAGTNDPLKQDFTKDQTLDAKEISWLTDPEKHKDRDSRLKSFFKDNNFYTTLDTVVQNNNTVDHYELLTKLIDEINRNNNSYKINQLALYQETNSKILKVFKEYFDKQDPAFRFPSTFNESVVVVGDPNMIQKYLYSGEVIPSDKSDLTGVTIDIILKGQNDSEYVKSPIQVFHPKDKVFFTADYHNKIYEVMYPDDENPPYGPNSEPPDIFAYTDTKDISKQGKKLNRYQVFKYNTQNANVLNLKIDLNPSYLVELKTGFQKELFKTATTKLAGIYSDEYTLNTFLSEEAIIGYIQNRLKSSEIINKEILIKEVSEILTANGIPDELKGDPITIAKNCLALAEGGMISKNRQTIIVDAFSPKNPAIIMSDMANQLYRKSLILVLETLPFFHISNIGHIHSPVLLFAQSGKLLNSNPSYENDPFFTFISGIYNVIGAKHIMDSGEIKSEFTLVRNQKALLKENNKNQKEESA
jgi:hypothetical protein